MFLQTIELIVGAIIALAVLLDVFATVVVPGRVRISVGIPSFVRAAALPAWRCIFGLFTRQRPIRIPSSFCGFLLLCVFIAWICTLTLGLGLMVHGARDQFQPHIRSFADALFQTGGAMMTLGLNGEQARGFARLIVVACGLCGLQVVTLTLTYIVQLQMALQQRDPLVIRLASVAGKPASPVRVLLTQKRLGLDGELASMFSRWEEWAAYVQHAHKSHPILAYFRSDEAHGDWVTALGAVADTAVLTIVAVDDPHKGHAELLLDAGTKTARQLCQLLGLEACEAWQLSQATVANATRQLAEAGFPLTPDAASAERINAMRAPYAASIKALAQHFGVEEPVWEA
ncbi:MAG TPA: hypothetical protein VH331_06480 [Allosphingosinicella sp.]|nr:hypothetical protein [Allosphingosinicella sp.]